VLDHLSVHAACHCPIDIPGLKHLFESVECAGIFHSHSFLICYLNADECVDLTNELEFGMCLSAFEQMSISDVPTTHAEAIDCNHHLIIWSLLGVTEWDAFQVMKARWDDMELNHLILNALALLINKIDATGAITVSAFDAALAHYKQYTLPAWSTKSGTPNFSAYAHYMVRPTYHHNIVKFMFIITI
jgi:hypothetical protein